MTHPEDNIATPQADSQLSDEQLQEVAGGFTPSLKDELTKEAGGKGLSGRIKDEFEAGLGNKAYSEEELRDQVGNG